MTNGGIQTVQGYLEPAGYTQVTSLSSAVGLGTIPPGTKVALIQPETKDIRWRDDGTNPTTTTGMILVANDTLLYSGTMSAFKMIEVAATGKVNITFYK